MWESKWQSSFHFCKRLVRLWFSNGHKKSFVTLKNRVTKDKTDVNRMILKLISMKPSNSDINKRANFQPHFILRLLILLSYEVDPRRFL